MPVFSAIAVAVAATAALSANTVTAQSNRITLYENTNHRGASKIVFVSDPILNLRRCYNIHNCFNDRASSATWELSFETRVVFHTDKDCQGSYRSWDDYSDAPYNPPTNFALDGINKAVSSVSVVPLDVIVGATIIEACYPTLFANNATAMDAAENGTNVTLDTTANAIQPST